MSTVINCNFVRLAIYHFTSKYFTKKHQLPKGSLPKILRDYNQHFKDYPALTVTYSIASKKFLDVARYFSGRWHPSEAKQGFLATFSIAQWNKQSSDDKAQHTLRQCKVCENKYQSLSQSFPSRQTPSKGNSESPQISFSPEALKTTSGVVLSALKGIQSTVLNKASLRASDYRKAVILMYQSLRHCSTGKNDITELFRTAAEISEVLYARPRKRTPRAVLRLHNLVYVHARLCTTLFAQSPRMRRIFGQYFHSITCHSPLVYRIVSLRLVNTEMQERMFGQAKQITKATSSLNPNHIGTNILIRVREEAKVCHLNPLASEEGVISKLAQVLGTAPNTVISKSWLKSTASQYQSHLERISDFLLPGPGIWWRHADNGIEFLDSASSPDHHQEGPNIHHYRSATLADIDLHLCQKWEESCSGQIELPAKHIRHYTSEGSLATITEQSPGITECDSNPSQSTSPAVTPDCDTSPIPPVVTPEYNTSPIPPVVTPEYNTSHIPPVVTPECNTSPIPPVVTPEYNTSPIPPVVTPECNTSPIPPVVTPEYNTSPIPPVVTPECDTCLISPIGHAWKRYLPYITNRHAWMWLLNRFS